MGRESQVSLFQCKHVEIICVQREQRAYVVADSANYKDLSRRSFNTISRADFFYPRLLRRLMTAVEKAPTWSVWTRPQEQIDSSNKILSSNKISPTSVDLTLALS